MLNGKLELIILCKGKAPENALSPLDNMMFSEVDSESPVLDSKGNTRSFYLYRPASGLAHCTSGVYLIREGSSFESAVELLEKTGWAERAERNQYAIILPNPTEAGWNVKNDAEGPDDYAFLHTVLTDGSTQFLLKGKVHRTSKYMAGFGFGAAMAVGVCMLHGEMIAGLFAQDAQIPAVSSNNPVPVPAWLVNPSPQVWRYFRDLDISSEFPCQQFSQGGRALWEKAWDEIFLGLRRWPVQGTGIVTHKSSAEEMGLEAHLDSSLGDNNGLFHEWYEFVPSIHKVKPDKKLPLILVLHGGSTSAKYCAEQNRWHELGERYGFFVVYPQASAHAVWNAGCDVRLPSDEEYLLALVNYLTIKYPVDCSRLYCTGFSMGSLMTQCMGMLHWDLFAAIAPFSGYLFDFYLQGPGVTPTQPYALTQKREDKLKTMRDKSAELPVIQFHGTLDNTWDENAGDYTRNFWSCWNGVPVFYPDIKPNRIIGADGRFSVYDSLNTGGLCLYRFVTVKDLPHSVDLRQPYLAWEFLSRYSREENSGQLQVD